MNNKAQKVRFSVILAGILLLVFGSYLNSSAQVCPFAKPDFDSTYSGTPVLLPIGMNDSVGPNPATISIVSGPSHGILTVINADSVIYTPGAGYVGIDSFQYTVCDTPGGCGCASSQAVIRVNAPPCFSPILVNDTFMLFSGTTTIVDFLMNDSAPSSSFASSSILSGPFHGGATSSGMDTLAYLPDSAYIGYDTVYYQACNACGACDTAAIYFMVMPPCLAPIALGDSFYIEHATLSHFSVTTNDVDGGYPFTSLSVIGAPMHGIASITGLIINYQPDSSYSGLDYLTYVVCNGCSCDTANVTVRVRTACIPPLALTDQLPTGYSPLCVAHFDVTSNDLGNDLTVTVVRGPFHGHASVTGTLLNYTADSTLFDAYDTVYYAITNRCGSDTAALIVFVNALYPCNGAGPAPGHDTVHVCRNDSIVVNVRANDYDVDGDYFAVAGIGTVPLHGSAYVLNDSEVVYKPDHSFSGTDTMFYRVCDDGTPALCNLIRLFVYVDSCKFPPVIIDENGNDLDTMYVNILEDHDTSICFRYTDSDSDQAALGTIYGLWEEGVFVRLNDTCLSLQTLRDMVGSDTVLITMCDFRDTLCDTVVMFINIIPVNDAPTANPDYVTSSNSSAIIINPLSNDTDPDIGDTLHTSYIVNLNPGAGTAVLNGDNTVTFTPDTNFAGWDTIVYAACDAAGLCDTSYIVVKVLVNARDDHSTTNTNVPVVIHVGANDATTSVTEFGLCGTPMHGTASMDNGTVTYTPANDYNGNDQFCYYICDSVLANCDTAYVYVKVQGSLFIPQGFSPNGDGINDFFNIVAIEQYPNSEVIIFNRWGDEVWRSGDGGYKNDAASGFVGNNKKGNPLTDGTYYYVVKFNSGNLENQSGFIELHR